MLSENQRIRGLISSVIDIVILHIAKVHYSNSIAISSICIRRCNKMTIFVIVKH